MATMQHQRTLVIQPLPGIGDMVWHLPLLRAIASQAPGGKITLLSKPSAQAFSLLKETALIEDIIPLTSASTFQDSLKELKKRNFKQAWTLHHSKRYYLLAFLAGIQERFGYGFGWNRIWLTDRNTLKRNQSCLSTLDRISTYMQAQGFKLTLEDRYFKASTTLQQEILHQFKAFPAPWVSFGIGATEEARRWPLTYFSTLATKLLEQGNKTIFLCCSAQEKERAHHVISLMKETSANIIPITNFTLEKTIALLSLSSLFIGNDSGLMNIAAALRIPSFGLFGTGSKHTYVPNLFGLNVTQEGLSPYQAMATITPSMVLSSLDKQQILPLFEVPR